MGAAELVARLQARRGELERATLARVYGIADPESVDDPHYATRLRGAVRAAVAYGIEGIENRSEDPPPVPPELLAQARHAACSGVPLDTVLRRYLAGYTLLGDFVAEAIGDAAVCGTELRRVWRAESALFDRLIAAVTDQYTSELDRRAQTPEQRRLDRVKRLLDGELIETDEIQYDFDAWHVGAVAAGPGATGTMRDLAKSTDRRLLLVRSDEQTVWGWFGGRCRVTAVELLRLAIREWPSEAHLALGEAAHGIDGWRLTHRQARAAIPIAIRGVTNVVRYENVALLATALRDEVLAASLREMLWAPLASQGGVDDGVRETLRAYFAAERNVSAAAAALGISRPTVKSRLQRIEERIGRSLGSCAAEMETVLHLQNLSDDRPGPSANVQADLPHR